MLKQMPAKNCLLAGISSSHIKLPIFPIALKLVVVKKIVVLIDLWVKPHPRKLDSKMCFLVMCELHLIRTPQPALFKNFALTLKLQLKAHNFTAANFKKCVLYTLTSSMVYLV